MKKKILYRCNCLSRFEIIVLISTFLMSLAILSALIFFILSDNSFIQSVYEQRSFGFFNQFIQNREHFPLEHYLAMKKDIAFNLFLRWLLFAGFGVSILMIIHRFFFSGKKIYLLWVIITCCAATAFLYLYNSEYKIISTHTFFRAQIVYQIMNGNCPPMDPLFGGEPLHYQWGYAWAAAVISQLFHMTPFDSFAMINVLTLAGCLWLLYKISNRLIDNPKVNIFCAAFTIYCGTIINNSTLIQLAYTLPFYRGENRVFPLLIKFQSNNGSPLGLVFFLLMVYATIRLFEKKKIIFNSCLILSGTACCIFFYAAFCPVILAWTGFIGLLWLMKYKKDDFRVYGQSLFILCGLIATSVMVLLPYLRQVSSVGGYSTVDILNPRILLENSFHFLLPSSLTLLIIIIFRRYLRKNLNHQNLSLTISLFVSAMACYLCFHFPSSVEYKFLLLALIPFGIIGGIAFSRIQHYSRWLALGLFFALMLPSFQLYRHQFESSSRQFFDFSYIPPFYENGTTLESSNPQENAMYQWIRENTSMNTYFLDKETKIPVYAQRSLWVGFDTGKKLPGYAMSISRLKALHGYDEHEYCQRQEVAQNIFGSKKSMSESQISAYLTQHQIFVIIRNGNAALAMNDPRIREVFCSENKQFRIIAPAAIESTK